MYIKILFLTASSKALVLLVISSLMLSLFPGVVLPVHASSDSPLSLTPVIVDLPVDREIVSNISDSILQDEEGIVQEDVAEETDSELSEAKEDTDLPEKENENTDELPAQDEEGIAQEDVAEEIDSELSEVKEDTDSPEKENENTDELPAQDDEGVVQEDVAEETDSALSEDEDEKLVAEPAPVSDFDTSRTSTTATNAQIGLQGNKLTVTDTNAGFGPLDVSVSESGIIDLITLVNPESPTFPSFNLGLEPSGDFSYTTPDGSTSSDYKFRAGFILDDSNTHRRIELHVPAVTITINSDGTIISQISAKTINIFARNSSATLNVGTRSNLATDFPSNENSFVLDVNTFIDIIRNGGGIAASAINSLNINNASFDYSLVLKQIKDSANTGEPDIAFGSNPGSSFVPFPTVPADATGVDGFISFANIGGSQTRLNDLYLNGYRLTGKLNFAPPPTSQVSLVTTTPFADGDTYINSAESTGTNSIIDTTGTRGNDPDLDRFAVIAADATCDGSVPFPSDNTQPTATTITSDNPDGEYKVCMQVSYASNNSNAYAETNPFISDTTAPTIGNITVTFTGETVSNNVTYLNEGDTVTVTVPVTEADQLQSNPELVVQFGNSPQRTLTPTTMTPVGATTTYTYEYTISATDSGSLTYNLSAVTDRAGNTVNPSETTENTIIAVTSSLTATIGTPTYSKQPTNGTTYLTTGDTITVPVSFSQAPTNGTSITGQLLSSGTPFGNPATATVSGTTANVVFTVQDGWNVAAGTLQFDITNETAITDQAGNQLATTTPQTISNVVIDTTTPTVGTIDVTFTGQTVTNSVTYLNEGDTVTITVPVTEANQLQSSPELVVQFGSSPQRTLTPTSTTPTTYTYEYTVSATDSGSLTYNLGAVTDRAGNTVNPSAVTPTGTDTIIADTTAPTIGNITITFTGETVSNNVTYLNEGDTVTITVPVTEADQLQSSPELVVQFGSSPQRTLTPTSTTPTTYTYEYTVSATDSGSLTYNLSAVTDRAGNTVNPSATIENTIIAVTSSFTATIGTPTYSKSETNGTTYLTTGDTITVPVSFSQAPTNGNQYHRTTFKQRYTIWQSSYRHCLRHYC